MDFDIGRFTRRCAATERELRPGDSFYSILLPVGADVERQDILASEWTGAPENAICWWKSRMPSSNARKVTWAPNEVILDYFLQLHQRGDHVDQLYVLTLLMIRRRILRLDESQADDQGGESMVLYCSSTESEYRIHVAEPTTERIAEIEQELSQLLFSTAE